MAAFEYEWYTEDEPSTAPLYAARAILPYLLIGNLRGASQAHLLFTSQLAKSNPNLALQEVTTTSSELRIYPSLPLLNFLGLLLLSVQRGAADLFRQLRRQYDAQLKEANWGEALDQIGEMYFQIKIPSQSNPLFDMMGSLLMGGGGGGQKGRGGSSGPPLPALD